MGFERRAEGDRGPGVTDTLRVLRLDPHGRAMPRESVLVLEDAVSKRPDRMQAHLGSSVLFC